MSKRIEEFKTPNDINVPNAALKDTPTSIHFEPLQIRSFRLHLEREVVKEEAVPVPLVSPIVVPSA